VVFNQYVAAAILLAVATLLMRGVMLFGGPMPAPSSGGP
jgi:hypothetical protein